MSYEQRQEIERAARSANLKLADWCRRELAAAVTRSAREREQGQDKAAQVE